MGLSKKILATVLVGAMMALPACGTNNNNDLSSPPSAPMELDGKNYNALAIEGSWIAEDQSANFYLAGFIEDGQIQLHWEPANTEAGAMYWAGSVDAPKDDTEPFTWQSMRDDGAMAMSQYAASDASMTFTYEAGRLTLGPANDGYVVTLVQSDIDFTGGKVLSQSGTTTGDNAKTDDESSGGKGAEGDNAENAANEKAKDVRLIDSGYTVESLGGGKSLIHYAVEIANPNEYNAIATAIIEITVRAKDGSLISKQKKTIAGVAPGETIFFGDAIKCQANSPDDISIEVRNNDYDLVPFEGSGVLTQKDLEISATSQDYKDGHASFSGRVSNMSGRDLEGVLITVVYFKDGKIVGGTTDSIGSLVAGDSVNFNATNKGKFSGYDDYKIFATLED